MACFNNFSKIAATLPKALSQAVRKTALDIQADAASRAPVDTGFLRNSIYTVTSDGSTYQGGDKALPEVQAPGDDQTAYVAVGANYGIYQEMGTTRTPAQPYFYPAVEAARGPFEQAMAKIEDKLKEASS
jgi:HK97 gp10 family phage protein